MVFVSCDVPESSVSEIVISRMTVSRIPIVWMDNLGIVVPKMSI